MKDIRVQESASNQSEKCGKISESHSQKLNLTPIQKFFACTNVFVTGGTGFLGMLLLEKLLFSCREISKIFLLVRTKKGKDVNTRLDELFEDVIFSRLKSEFPNFREKIIVVEGDCELPQLGLGSQDREMLNKEVHIVFHAAATVRFDEALKKASFINIRAVRDILILARQMPNLKSFVHISTVFSNCIHKFIKEEVYPPSMDYRSLLNLTEALPDDILEKIAPVLQGEYPNTYSFTKQIGEDVVKQLGQELPIGIHRPSIVISTYKEPLQGWINNVYGLTGLAAGTEMGVFRCPQCKANYRANMVPADFMVNSVIASAWHAAENFKKQKGKAEDILVYNFEADQGPVITWGDFVKACIQFAHGCPTLKALWYIWCIPCETRRVYLVMGFFLHKVPGFIVDTALKCLGKRPVLLKVYGKVDKLIDVAAYFATNEWKFQSDNIPRVISEMSKEDRKIFYCDLKNMDWMDYLKHYMLGIRLYLLKDPLDTLPQALKRYRRLYWLHQFVKAALAVFLLWILWSCVPYS